MKAGQIIFNDFNNVEVAIFESHPLPPLALPLPPLALPLSHASLGDVIFAQNFLILKFFGKIFFHPSRDIEHCYHHLKNVVKHQIVFSGLSSQGSAHGRSQEFEFRAALKRRVKSHGRYVSADVDLSERSPRFLK